MHKHCKNFILWHSSCLLRNAFHCKFFCNLNEKNVQFYTSKGLREAILCLKNVLIKVWNLYYNLNLNFKPLCIEKSNWSLFLHMGRCTWSPASKKLDCNIFQHLKQKLLSTSETKTLNLKKTKQGKYVLTLTVLLATCSFLSEKRNIRKEFAFFHKSLNKLRFQSFSMSNWTFESKL